MKKKFYILILIISTIFALQYYFSQTVDIAKDTAPLYSQSIPDLSLVPINGTPFKLSDKKGSLYILNFWATWCGPCTIEIPHLIKLHNKYKAQGVVIIGISLDDTDIPVTQFITKHKINYPISMFNATFPDFLRQLPGIPATLTLDKSFNIIDIAIGYRNQNYFEKMIKRAIN